jgi:predicted AAA+ superfamily ATPase
VEGQFREAVAQKLREAPRLPLPNLTRRDVYVPSVPGRAVAVMGMRRAGKTSFLWQLLSDRARAGTPRDGLLYFNFDDERLTGMEVPHLSLLAEEYFRQHPEWRGEQRATWLLDEIQLVPEWERFTRRILDTENVELFLSGSSAKLLSREIATSMRGRTMEAMVHPFSFREYLRHHGREPGQPADRLVMAERSALQKELLTYLQLGGFPELQRAAARERNELLRNHVDVTLLRDVIERHNVSSPNALRWMTRQLLSNPAGAFSVHKFYQDLKAQQVAVGKETLHDYLGHLEDAFLIHTLPLATTSERRRQVNPRKVFPVDPGLVAVFDRSGKANLGHALETVVLLVLLRRGAEVGYVKTGAGLEVDFLARFPDGSQQLIQVCADIASDVTLVREYRALDAAAREHNRATRHLVTLTPEAVTRQPEGVQVHSAEVWLLTEDHRSE